MPRSDASSSLPSRKKRRDEVEVLYRIAPESRMGFSSVAEKVEAQPYMRRKRGESDGVGRLVYFERSSWERLKARCEARGISVSRYLQTLAELSLDEDER